MRKKFLIIFILISILILPICYAFSDTENHWAKSDIDSLYLNKIVSGYQDDTFKPNNKMTRAEFVTIINRMLGNTLQNNRYIPDINVKNWYFVEIRKAIESGLIKGDSNGYVKPNDYITRQEAMVILYRAFLSPNTAISTKEIKDIDKVSSWAREAVNSFLVYGYLNGYKDGTIRPRDNITRAEVVTLIKKIIGCYADFGGFKGDLYGNVLVRGKNVSFENVIVNGDLIIAEGAENFSLYNIIVRGNILLRRDDIEFPKENFVVKGEIISIISKPEEDKSKYENIEYGIRFSLPDDANVILISGDRKNLDINYRKKNLMLIDINQSDDLYFKSFNQGAQIVRNKYDNSFDTLLYEGKIGIYKYQAYSDNTEKTQLLYIKRDNIEYIIYFFNVDNINVIDSLVNSIEFFDGTKTTFHKMKVYKNPNLHLNFKYLDYVSVDDSYNTSVVSEEEAFYKFFIQVTNIIDMSDYTIDQLKDILVSLEDTAGVVEETKIQKVYIYDAIEYTIRNDNKITKSLYVVISNKLYHFIFVGEEDKFEPVGMEIYQDIVNSIEF